ncbi:MAG: hypothetical protein ACI9S8_001262 [Chlamydiales bacterium]|jgi:hypothetical protein
MISCSDDILPQHNLTVLENYSPGSTLIEKDDRIYPASSEENVDVEGNDEKVRNAILQSLDWIENTFHHAKLPLDLSNRSIHQISSSESINRLRDNILNIHFQNPCEKFTTKMTVHRERLGKLHKAYLEVEQKKSLALTNEFLSQFQHNNPELLNDAIDTMVASRVCSDPKLSWEEGFGELVERLRPRTPNKGSGGAFFVPGLSHIAINGEEEFIMRQLMNTLGFINALIKTLSPDECPELWEGLIGLRSTLNEDHVSNAETLSQINGQLSEILALTAGLNSKEKSDIQKIDNLYQLLSKIHFDLRPFLPLLLEELKGEEIEMMDPDIQKAIEGIKGQGQQKIIQLMNKIRLVDDEEAFTKDFSPLSYFDRLLSKSDDDDIDEASREIILSVRSEVDSIQEGIKIALEKFLELEELKSRNFHFFLKNLNEIGDPESEFTKMNEEYRLLEAFGLSETANDEEKSALVSRLNLLIWELPTLDSRKPLVRLLDPEMEISEAERESLIAEIPILVQGDENNDLALEQLTKLVLMRKEKNERKLVSKRLNFDDSLINLSGLGSNICEKKDRLKVLSDILKELSASDFALYKKLHKIFEDLYSQQLRLIQRDMRTFCDLMMSDLNVSVLDKSSRYELEGYVQRLTSPELNPGYIDSLSRPARAILSRTKKVILDRAPLLEKLEQSINKIRNPLEIFHSLDSENLAQIDRIKHLKSENPAAYVQEFARFANEKFRDPQARKLFMVNDQFVAKPIGLEPAMPKSRTKIKVKRQHLPEGIEPGEGAIREVAAYILQAHLGFDCGVPPTLLISSTHPFLGDSGEVMSLQKKVAYSDDSFSIGEDLEKLPDSAMDSVLLHIAMMQMDGHGHNLAISDDKKKFILIDNGLSLPHPSPSGSPDCQGLRYARYGWMVFPQAKTHLSTETREKIARWDIPEIAASFKEAMETAAAHFPDEEHCKIADACFQLLELNLHLIKVGAELDKTYREIGSVHVLSRKARISPPQFVGGEIIEIYKNHILGKDEVDWNAVEQNFRNVLTQTNGERLALDIAFKSGFRGLEDEMAKISDEEGSPRA